PRLEATYHFLRRVVVRRELLAAPIAPSLELALDRPLLKRLSVPVVVPHRRQASASSWLRASPPPPLLATSRSPCRAKRPAKPHNESCKKSRGDTFNPPSPTAEFPAPPPPSLAL